MKLNNKYYNFSQCWSEFCKRSNQFLKTGLRVVNKRGEVILITKVYGKFVEGLIEENSTTIKSVAFNSLLPFLTK